MPRQLSVSIMAITVTVWLPNGSISTFIIQKRSTDDFYSSENAFFLTLESGILDIETRQIQHY